MIDLFLVMNHTYTVAEVLTAGDQPHRLAWLRRVPTSIGDWEVWTPDVIPAHRRILERFPDVGAGSAQWPAVEWCRVHWEQLLRSTLTVLVGYAAGMTYLLLREHIHGEGQVEMISDGWVAHVVEHLLNGELDAAMSHLRCVGKTVDADAAAVEALQLLWEAAHTNEKQTGWTADDDRLLAECMKGGQA